MSGNRQQVATLTTIKKAAANPKKIRTDHALVLIETTLKDDTVFKALSWNMLGASGVSGFGNEPYNHEQKQPEDRKERFKTMLKDLKRSADQQKANAILLQETDVELIKEINEEDPTLLAGWVIPSRQGISSKDCNTNKDGYVTDMLTLYREKEYELLLPPKYLPAHEPYGETAPARILSCTLQNRSTNEVIDLHNIWGNYLYTIEEQDRNQRELKHLLTKAPQDHTSLVLGDTNYRAAEIHDKPVNCGKNLVPTIFNKYLGISAKDEDKIQVADCADAGFVRIRNGTTIQQATIHMINPENGEIVTKLGSRKQAKPHPRKLPVYTLDDSYAQEEAVLTELLGQGTFKYRVISNSFNEKENYLEFNDNQSYERFYTLMRITQTDEGPLKAKTGLIALTCQNDEELYSLLEEYKTRASFSSTPIIIKNGDDFYIYASNLESLGSWGNNGKDPIRIDNEDERKALNAFYGQLENRPKQEEAQVETSIDQQVDAQQKNDITKDKAYIAPNDALLNPKLVNVLGRYHTPFCNTVTFQGGKTTVKIPRETFKNVLLPKAKEIRNKATQNSTIANEKREAAIQKKMTPLKGLLIGAVVGLVFVGVIAASVATFGAAGIIAGGAVGALAALGTVGGSIGVTVAIAEIGVAICAAVGALTTMATKKVPEPREYHEYVDDILYHEYVDGKLKEALAEFKTEQDKKTSLTTAGIQSGLAEKPYPDTGSLEDDFDEEVTEFTETEGIENPEELSRERLDSGSEKTIGRKQIASGIFSHTLSPVDEDPLKQKKSPELSESEDEHKDYPRLRKSSSSSE